MKLRRHTVNTQMQIPAGELKLGMYVSKLDRPWLETRFILQGFLLETIEEINELKDLCQYVYIDVTKGITTGRPKHNAPITPSVSDQKIKKVILKKKHVARSAEEYENQTTVEQEIEHARKAKRQLNHTFETIIDDLLAGKTVKIDEAREAVQNMISSVIRNPDAMLWLTKLKTSDDYTYRHSIDVSTLAVSFGRHLGLPKNALEDIAFGSLMIDIGKLKLPRFILEKQDKLTEREFTLVKRHVPVGVELAQQIKGIRSTSLEIIGFHHERHDGRGYPNNLVGFNIPMYARIAALVDCYDAITSDRPYADGIPQAEALRQLYSWRNRDFQADLVEQFIQCLGVYPTGSLVELSNGTVGIVISQNRTLRLRPRVMLILDEDKQPYDFAPVVDLADEEHDEETDNALCIVRTADAEAYGIDPREFYLS